MEKLIVTKIEKTKSRRPTVVQKDRRIDDFFIQTNQGVYTKLIQLEKIDKIVNPDIIIDKCDFSLPPAFPD